jgi:plastocyanin
MFQKLNPFPGYHLFEPGQSCQKIERGNSVIKTVVRSTADNMTRKTIPESNARQACRHLAIGAVIIIMVCSWIGGCTTSTSVGSTPATATPGPAGSSSAAPALAVTAGPAVTVDLQAKNMAFSTSEIMVPAGAAVTLNFRNREPSGSSQVTGIAHNFAVYDSAAATRTIFSGAIITGGEDIVYTFTAPGTPGTYFFRCDVHPTVMNGRFIVT